MSTDIDTTDGTAGDTEPGLVRRAYRTVTPGYGPRADAGMDAIGWTVFLGTLALLFPLLPFLVVVWLVSRGIEAFAGDDE